MSSARSGFASSSCGQQRQFGHGPHFGPSRVGLRKITVKDAAGGEYRVELEPGDDSDRVWFDDKFIGVVFKDTYNANDPDSEPARYSKNDAQWKNGESDCCFKTRRAALLDLIALSAK